MACWRRYASRSAKNRPLPLSAVTAGVIACFNVYLESEERLSSYLARLQNLAGERPLLLGEILVHTAKSTP
jgi:hypothetical protein